MNFTSLFIQQSTKEWKSKKSKLLLQYHGSEKNAWFILVSALKLVNWPLSKDYSALKTLEQTFGSIFLSSLALFCSLILLYICIQYCNKVTVSWALSVCVFMCILSLHMHLETAHGPLLSKWLWNACSKLQCCCALQLKHLFKVNKIKKGIEQL